MKPRALRRLMQLPYTARLDAIAEGLGLLVEQVDVRGTKATAVGDLRQRYWRRAAMGK